MKDLTLRDYFAARAMPVILNSIEKDGKKQMKPFEEVVANVSYMIADAMLKARDKSTQEYFAELNNN